MNDINALRWKVCLRLRQFPQRLQSPVWKDGGYVRWVLDGKYYGATESECADHAVEVEFPDTAITSAGGTTDE